MSICDPKFHVIHDPFVPAGWIEHRYLSRPALFCMLDTYVIPCGTTVQLSRYGEEHAPTVLKHDITVHSPQPNGTDLLGFQVGQWNLLVPHDAVVPIHAEDGRFCGPAFR
jgi:hypothetical protein